MFKFQCIYKKIFGIECPTCGMTRAIKSLMSLDFESAFKYNNMVVFVPIFLLLLVNILFIKNTILMKMSKNIITLILYIWIIWYVFLSNRVL